MGKSIFDLAKSAIQTLPFLGKPATVTTPVAVDPVDLAENNPSMAYAGDQGTARDFSTTLKWYRKGALQGNIATQISLGLAYASGKGGVAQDFAEATKWYRMAAELGDAVGQLNLGNSYRRGRGVTQDYAEAMEWYRKSAEQGCVFAYNNLGMLYASGKGVPQSYADAAKWFRQAAEHHCALAQSNLGALHEKGEKNYTEAVNCYLAAVDKNLVQAQFNLARMYYHGRGVRQNRSEAVKWYEKAARQGSAEAQYALGIIFEGTQINSRDANRRAIYDDGEKIMVNPVHAYVWFTMAATQGHKLAAKGLTRLEKILTPDELDEVKELMK